MNTQLSLLMMIILLLPAMIYCIFAMIAYWRLMRKMHRPGWFIFIPYAPIIVFYGRCWRLGAFWRYLIANLAVAVSTMVVAPYMVAGSPEMFTSASNVTILAALVIMLVAYIIILVNFIRLNVHIAHAFGKSAGFAVGLILLPGIFYLILGLSKMEYIGKQK